MLHHQGTLQIKLLSKQARLTTKFILFIIIQFCSHRQEPKKHRGDPSSFISISLSSKDPAFGRWEKHRGNC